MCHALCSFGRLVDNIIISFLDNLILSQIVASHRPPRFTKAGTMSTTPTPHPCGVWWYFEIHSRMHRLRVSHHSARTFFERACYNLRITPPEHSFTLPCSAPPLSLTLKRWALACHSHPPPFEIFEVSTLPCLAPPLSLTLKRWAFTCHSHHPP